MIELKKATKANRALFVSWPRNEVLDRVTRRIYPISWVVINGKHFPFISKKSIGDSE